jgi:hypothetical protein
MASVKKYMAKCSRTVAFCSYYLELQGRHLTITGEYNLWMLKKGMTIPDHSHKMGKSKARNFTAH